MFPEAVIFDLDGTLIDNNAYHIEAWKAFYEKIGKQFSLQEYLENINGRVNRDIFNHVLNTDLSDKEIADYADSKEKMYRKLYAPYIKPIPGLIEFLEVLEKENIPQIIATSGMATNINFMFDNIPIKKYFPVVIDASQITHGKPHPEIFLKAAAAANANPVNCIAFEDSIAGIRSAKAAGITVIALTTTHTANDVKEADYIIKDYTEISLTKLRELNSVAVRL